MYSECTTCGQKISWEAYRCPHCGQPDAGELAKFNHDQVEKEELKHKRDDVDPRWRDKEAAERRQRESISSANEKTLNRRNNWDLFFALIFPVYVLPLATSIWIIIEQESGPALLVLAAAPVFNWFLILNAFILLDMPLKTGIPLISISGALVWFIFRPRNS